MRQFDLGSTDMLCKVGEIEVWRILEINGPFMRPDELFSNTSGDVAEQIEALAPGSVDHATGKLILPVQGFLLKTPSGVILVDACVGNNKTAPNDPDWNNRNDTRFMASLLAAGIRAEDVDYVLCTHLHIDHVGWNTKLLDGRWVPTFPNAKYLLPEADQEAFEGSVSYTESVLPVIAAGQAELVSGAHALGDEITLVPTPGHTPGHVSVLLNSGGAQALITGDALHTSAQCANPEWHFVYDKDAEMAVSSRRAFLEDASERGCKVLGSHFLLPSVGRVTADKDAFKWHED